MKTFRKRYSFGIAQHDVILGEVLEEREYYWNVGPWSQHWIEFDNLTTRAFATLAYLLCFILNGGRQKTLKELLCLAAALFAYQTDLGRKLAKNNLKVNVRRYHCFKSVSNECKVALQRLSHRNCFYYSVLVSILTEGFKKPFVKQKVCDESFGSIFKFILGCRL